MSSVVTPMAGTPATSLDRWRDAALLLAVGLFSAGYATVALVALLIVFSLEALTRRWRWYRTGLEVPLAVLVIVALASALSSAWRSYSLATVLLLALVVLLPLRAVPAAMAGRPGFGWSILTVWAAGAVGAAAVGIGRYLLLGGPAAATPALGQNALGTTLAIGTVLAAGLLVVRQTPVPRWPLAAALPILIVGLILTFTRGAWVSTVCGLLVLLLAAPGPRARVSLLLIGVGATALGAALVAGSPGLRSEVQSMGSMGANRNRLLLWQTGLRMVADHPGLGTGFGTFVFAYQQYRVPDSPDVSPPFAHNVFLNFAAETGVLGLAAFVVVFVTALWAAWGWTRRAPPGSSARAMAAATFAALVTLLVTQQFDGTMMSVHLGFGFYALLAMAAWGRRYPGTDTAAAAPAPATFR